MGWFPLLLLLVGLGSVTCRPYENETPSSDAGTEAFFCPLVVPFIPCLVIGRMCKVSCGQRPSGSGQGDPECNKSSEIALVVDSSGSMCCWTNILEWMKNLVDAFEID